jgi:hypothetical protein
VLGGGNSALKINGGTLTLQGGTASPTSFSLTAGTFINEAVLDLPVFDGSVVSGGTFLNRGRLDIATGALVVPNGVTLIESGSLGSGDSIRTLTLNGILKHEAHDPLGLSFTVTGDATIGGSGSIDVDGLGLYGGKLGSNVANQAGEGYSWNGQRWVVAPIGGIASAGSHGGPGGANSGKASGPTNDALATPVLLGSGGSGFDATYTGGNGGGRVDLVVNGTLQVAGVIRANGAAVPGGGEGGGAGGSIRLRVGTLAGAGSVQANGGRLGGGGGRIAVDYVSKTFTGGLSVAGGASGTNFSAGAAGTISERDEVANPAQLPALLRGGAQAVCQLASSGKLSCQGDDTHGLVSQTPAGVYSRLAMGPNVACALHIGGVAQCWGETASRGLHNEPSDLLTDIAVGLTVACGMRQSDASLVCWGDDADGLISQRPAGGFVSVSMADNSACAQPATGPVTCWGSDAGQAVSGAPLASVSKLDGGADFFCGVLSDGTLACWGDDTFGQCQAPGGSGYTDVSAGGQHACALAASGQVMCWGDNDQQQASPPPGTFVSVAAGDDYSCGGRDDGSLACWGAAL